MSSRVEFPPSVVLESVRRFTPNIHEVSSTPQEIQIQPSNFSRETENNNLSRREWWRTAVTLQIYPRSYRDSNGDGNGDVRGITQNMNHIQDLGVDAIWLTPIHASPWKDGGYDVSSYNKINPMFGDRKDVVEMVQAAHERGIRVIFDIVMNHTSVDHPWYKDSQKSEVKRRRELSGYDYKVDPRANVYHFRPSDPENPNKPPNNWTEFHGGKSAWVKDAVTDEWVFGKFISAGQADLNLRNPLVRSHMIKTAGRWVKQYGIDGERMDVIDHTFEDPDFRDFEPDTHPKGNGYMDSWKWKERYLLDDAYEFASEISEKLDSTGKEVVSIGEVYYEDGTDFSHLRDFYTRGKLKIPFNFALLATTNQHGASGIEYKKVWERYVRALPEGACPNSVLSNHDQVERLADIVGPKNMPVVMMMLLTLGDKGGSNSFIYMGDEIGMVKGPAINKGDDPDPMGKNLGSQYSRSNSRKGYPWDISSTNAGFSEGKPWLPSGMTMDGRGALEQIKDPRSMLSLTRQLLRARKKELSALQYGEYIACDTGDPDLFAYIRRDTAQNGMPGQELLVTLNFSRDSKRLILPKEGRLALSTNYDQLRGEVGQRMQIEPHEGCVIELGRTF